MEDRAMNLEKLKPWNWFKHDDTAQRGATVPVRRQDYQPGSQPLQSLNDFHREIDRLFDDVFRRLGIPGLQQLDNQLLSGSSTAMRFTPEINIASNDDGYEISVEAPGLEEKDLSLEIIDRQLLIRGNKQQESETREQHFYHIERRYGSFQRVLTLPDDANINGISANMKNGVLTVHIERLEKPGSNSRRITIEHG